MRNNIIEILSIRDLFCNSISSFNRLWNIQSCCRHTCTRASTRILYCMGMLDSDPNNRHPRRTVSIVSARIMFPVAESRAAHCPITIRYNPEYHWGATPSDWVYHSCTTPPASAAMYVQVLHMNCWSCKQFHMKWTAMQPILYDNVLVAVRTRWSPSFVWHMLPRHVSYVNVIPKVTITMLDDCLERSVTILLYSISIWELNTVATTVMLLNFTVWLYLSTV